MLAFASTAATVFVAVACTKGPFVILAQTLYGVKAYAFLGWPLVRGKTANAHLRARLVFHHESTNIATIRAPSAFAREIIVLRPAFFKNRRFHMAEPLPIFARLCCSATNSPGIGRVVVGLILVLKGA